MPIDRPTAEHLAALCATLRTAHGLTPQWDTQGALHFLGKLAHDPAPPATIALAAIRAATDPGARTPAVIPHKDGLHWQTEKPLDLPRPRLTPEHECPRHVGQWATTCSPCAGEKLAPIEDDDHQPDDLGGHPTNPQQAARYAITQARQAAHQAHEKYLQAQAKADNLQAANPMTEPDTQDTP